MRLATLIADCIEKLKAVGIESASLDARLLAGHVLGLDRVRILSQSEREISASDVAAVMALIERRAKRESVGRIIGRREFWGLEFGLNEATLEPRPDSETLVEGVLRQAPRAKRVLDLGTGTGCLLLALLHEMPEATGLGIDVSARAVEQARANAMALGLAERSAFREGNWFAGVEEKFDVIVSNPPYIPAGDIAGLMPEVREYDPMLALEGGADGLAPYRIMVPQMRAFLNTGGVAAVELGIGQADEVKRLFEKAGFKAIEAWRDLGRVERCVVGLVDAHE